MITCHRCNHQNPDTASQCAFCGADLSASGATPSGDPLGLDDLELVDLNLNTGKADGLEDLQLDGDDLFGLGDDIDALAVNTTGRRQRASLSIPAIGSDIPSPRSSGRKVAGGGSFSKAAKGGSSASASGLAKLLQDALGGGDPSPVPSSSGTPAKRSAPPKLDFPGAPAPPSTGKRGSAPAKQPGKGTDSLSSIFEKALADSGSGTGVASTHQGVKGVRGTFASADNLDPASSFSLDDSEVQCPSCGGDNPPGMYYCVHCGSNLKDRSKASGVLEALPNHTASCPSCGHLNDPNSRFCGSCGNALDAPGTASSSFKSVKSVSAIDSADEEVRVPSQWDIKLISINEDGSDGMEIPLNYLKTVIGRSGDTRFPTDAFLSPKHACLMIEHGELHIEDLYSLNGTFVKIRDEVPLSPGDLFLMGRQVIRFEKFEQTITPKARSSDGTRYMGSTPPGGNFKLLQIGIGDIIQNVYCIPESGVVLGREKGEIIFPRDKFVSGRHAQIYRREDGTYCLVDLNSSNGTWIKIWEKTRLQNADFIFLGQQLFRVDIAD